MKYIGNYADWIKQEWIDYLLNETGYPRPRDKVLENSFEEQQNKSVSNNGYEDRVYWYKFTPDNFPFDLKPPIGDEKLWWFVKLLPGNLITMHRDQEEEIGNRTTLYWMSMIDYEPGHLFVSKDELLINYKKGDLFKLDHANDLHGSCI